MYKMRIMRKSWPGCLKRVWTCFWMITMTKHKKLRQKLDETLSKVGDNAGGQIKKF
jgi:hypothetical protein